MKKKRKKKRKKNNNKKGIWGDLLVATLDFALSRWDASLTPRQMYGERAGVGRYLGTLGRLARKGTHSNP